MWVQKLISVIFIIININLKIMSCDKSSLVFVVDETFSMQNDMVDVKKQTKEMLLLSENSGEIDNFVLVSVEDPVVAVRSKTNSSEAYRLDLSNLKASVRKNGNCEEPLLTGVKKALEESKSGSRIYVFSDALANDYDKAVEVTDLAKYKQSQITFILTGECPNNKGAMVFYEIAAASGGLVLHIDHQLLYKTLPLFKLLLDSKYSTALSQVLGQTTTKPHEDIMVQFTIDESVDEILVAAFGPKVLIGLQFVQDKSQPKAETIRWTSNFKAMKIINPKPGLYKARVSVNGLTSFVVYTHVGITFEYGFTYVEPHSIKDTSMQPIAGKPEYLLLNITDPYRNVEIQSLQILNLKESAVIADLPLRKIKENLYTTDAIKFPDHTFKIKVLGKNKKTNENISKISRTAIEPQLIYRRPTITNEVTDYYAVEGDKAVIIKCDAEGYPEPTISWRVAGNTPYNYYTYKTNNNILYITDLVASDQSMKFECAATNNVNTDRTTFTVSVTKTFENDNSFYGDIQDVYVVKGSRVKIPCDVVHSETDSVRWFIDGHPSNKKGSAFVIEKVTDSDEKNYTCRVNTNQATEVKSYTMDVGYTPTFQNEKPYKNIYKWTNEYGPTISLDCEANAKPTQEVEWTHDGIKMNSAAHVLSVEATDWGKYTCNVSNIHGSIQRMFEVVSPGCYLTNNLDDPMPLIVNHNTRTWPESITNREVLVKEHEIIDLACPFKTQPNSFQLFGSKTVITAQCLTQDQLSIDNKIYTYKDLQCKTSVVPSLLKTSKQCAGPDSELIEVGFAVNGFVDAYTVCYDKNKNVPLYANTYKNISKSTDDIDTSAFKWILVPGLGHGMPTGYTCDASNKTCDCYAKGQLLRADELPFGPAQAATFVENLNSVAIWNQCDEKRVSWLQFEKEMKGKSSLFQAMCSWTGASEYVSKNGGFVPRYLWKMIEYEDDDQKYSIAMVYVNDDSPNDSDVRCTECIYPIMELSDKYLYCCNPEEFSDVFGIDLDNFRSI